ncbi:acetyltransferase [Clostridia bacterium]|nr:acetyltransferase [Clostridia bacterium]
MSDNLTIKVGTFVELGAVVAPLRDAVFCDEQGIPDGVLMDDENSTICAVFSDEQLVATTRLTGNRVGQVATAKDLRGKGYGKAALISLINFAKEKNFSELVVQAQTQAEGFYRKCGFVPVGASYFEGEFELVDMELKL